MGGLLEGKTILDHRHHHRFVDRVPRGEGRAGAGREGDHHRYPRSSASHRPHRPATAAGGARRPSGSMSPTRRTSAALADKVRELAPEGIDGVLHSIALRTAHLMGPERCRSWTRPGGRGQGVRDLRLELRRAGPRRAARDERGRLHRGHGLRSAHRDAVLQLDGCGQGRARVGEPLRGAGSGRRQADSLQPGCRRADQDAGRQGHRRAPRPTTRPS